jgi:hypothetical protein
MFRRCPRLRFGLVWKSRIPAWSAAKYYVESGKSLEARIFVENGCDYKT